MRPVPALLAAVLALAACDRPAKQAQPKVPESAAAPAGQGPVGFRHDPMFDAQGFYHPATEVAVGTLALTSLGVGAPSDFAAWESGDRAAVFGPILLQFEDKASPMVADEAGEHRAITLRILPAAYEVDGARLRFTGVDGQLGKLTFEGAFPDGALAQAKQAGGGDPTVVLVGDLSIAGKVFPKTAFTYFAGD